MILELADLYIHPGKQAEFEIALERGLDSVISKAKGFLGYQINKGIESPERYALLIYWQTIDNHIIDFRESPAFLEWRAIISPYLAQTSIVEHFNISKKL